MWCVAQFVDQALSAGLRSGLVDERERVVLDFLGEALSGFGVGWCCPVSAAALGSGPGLILGWGTLFAEGHGDGVDPGGERCLSLVW